MIKTITKKIGNIVLFKLLIIQVGMKWKVTLSSGGNRLIYIRFI